MTRIEEQLGDEENKRICERVSRINKEERNIYLEAYGDALKYAGSIYGSVSLLSMWCPLPREKDLCK